MRSIPRVLFGVLLVLWAAGVVAAPTSAEDPPPEPASPAPPEEPAAPEAEEEPPLTPIETPSGRPLELEIVGARPILGPRPEAGLRTIPGSGESFTADDVRRMHEALSVQDAVRGEPGIVVRREDPSGVVLNMGVRGLNPDRSEKMLILEDGVPAGLAPYIENAAYYVPPFERIERFEILKGSGQILYGPHTVGAVVNLITPEIPRCPTALVRGLVGTDGYLMGYGRAGATSGRLGYLVSVLGKSGDGFRDHSSFDVMDVSAKLRWTFSPCTNVTLKGNWYDQESRQSYLSMTTPMYEERYFQNPARHDLLTVDWRGAQLTFQHFFRPDSQLLVNVYWSDATRDWNRQDFARNVGFAPPPANTVETVGDTAVDGGAIYLRSSFGSRDRDFTKWGIEPRWIGTYRAFGGTHEAHLGLRYHHEKMIDERNNRATLHDDPVTRNRDVREVDAWAGFGNTTLHLGDRLAVTPGLRVEAFESSRHFDVVNGNPVDVDGESDTVEWIPGLGVTWQADRAVTLFAGVHRGFSPARTEQAIDSAGEDLDLEPERSWNYEAGARGRHGSWLAWEATGFFMDFTNQVVPANESGGASTANTNAGETRHWGLELAGSVELVQALRRRCEPGCTRLWLDAAYTYLDTENVTPGGLFEGKELPYAPHHSGHVGLRLELPRGWQVGSHLSYLGEQWSDQANTVEPDGTGRIGRIPSHWLLDLTVRYRPAGTHLTFSASVNNVLDERYIVSRAPEGIFPGAPTTFLAGLEVEL